jgi:hypothetical protein
MCWIASSVVIGGLENKRFVLQLCLLSLPFGRDSFPNKYQEFLAAKASALRFASPSITAAKEPLVLTSLLKVER